MDLVVKIYESVQANYKELRRSIIGGGQFELAETHSGSSWRGMPG